MKWRKILLKHLKTMSKYITISVIIVAFLTITSCGSIVHFNRNFKPRSSVVDYNVLFFDSLFLPFHVLPGVLLIFTDYFTGALFIPQEELSVSKEAVK